MTCNTIDYARSQLEWMNPNLGQQFDSMKGHPYALKPVHILSSLNQLEQVESNGLPMTVLASGCNLDNGPARDLFLKWADNPDNAVIFTDYQRSCTPRVFSSNEEKPNLFSTAAQLLYKWCEANYLGKEMDEMVVVDVLVPHRAPLAGKDLQLFLNEEERKKKLKREEEEKRVMLREVELARGRLRLGVVDDDMQPSKTPNTEDESKEVVESTSPKKKRKKSRFDSKLFLKFSKPVYMTYDIREEAVGIGQTDSIAKFGRESEVLEDDYGIAVIPQRFRDIVTGVDPSKFTLAPKEESLDFEADGEPVLSGATAVPNDSDVIATEMKNEVEDALEASDLSEGKGIIRGRKGRPHIKVSTKPKKIEVLAEIAYVPLEGRVDAKAARQSVRALQPRQLVILGGASSFSTSINQQLQLLRKSALSVLTDSSYISHLEDQYKSKETFIGETGLLADVLRDSAIREKKLIQTVFAPSDGETQELNVGHATYPVRLIDSPYIKQMDAEGRNINEDNLSELINAGQLLEPFEAKMGDYTVSLADFVSTGQKVAGDGSIVLAPRPVSEYIHHPGVMISKGDILLTDLRTEIIAQGMKAEYSTGQLLINNKINVKKNHATQKLDIDGPLCEDFFTVRNMVCSLYVTL